MLGPDRLEIYISEKGQQFDAPIINLQFYHWYTTGFIGPNLANCIDFVHKSV